MRIDTTRQSVVFKDLFGKRVVARFDQPDSSSDGGALLLKACDERLGLTDALARCLPDGRQQSKVAHSFHDLVRQRVFGIACGYEDCNDAARVGNDPVHKLLVGRDPIFDEVLLNPKLMALTDLALGRGALISQLTSSVKPQARRLGIGLGLHADQNWFPEPFPEHMQTITCCWACDEFTLEQGATMVIPKSHFHRRLPTREEMAACEGAVPIECPAGSIVVWNGETWHGSYKRTSTGERVVLHITYGRNCLRPIESYDHLGDDYFDVRAAGAIAAAKARHRGAADKLIALIDDPHGDVQESAVLALGIATAAKVETHGNVAPLGQLLCNYDGARTLLVAAKAVQDQKPCASFACGQAVRRVHHAG